MTNSAFGWYAASGLIGLGVALALGELKHGIAILIAWNICAVPFFFNWIRQRLAKSSVNSKMPIKSTLPIDARSILLRMGWVLVASAAAYRLRGEWLGVAFWVAVLIYYQIALAIDTFVRVRSRKM